MSPAFDSTSRESRRLHPPPIFSVSPFTSSQRCRTRACLPSHGHRLDNPPSRLQPATSGLPDAFFITPDPRDGRWDDLIGPSLAKGGDVVIAPMASSPHDPMTAPTPPNVAILAAIRPCPTAATPASLATTVSRPSPWNPQSASSSPFLTCSPPSRRGPWMHGWCRPNGLRWSPSHALSASLPKRLQPSCRCPHCLVCVVYK